MNATISIGDRRVGGSAPCFVIAEIAQAHDGSLGLAHSFIDAAASAGVDAIKFQTHIADAESTQDEPFRVAFGYEDKTRFDYWKRMEFTAEQWRGLADHARDAGLCFLSSAFSLEAVALLEEIGVPAWKIGSGEFAFQALRDRMMQAGGPLLYSTGMSGTAETDGFVDWSRAGNASFAVFQCTSKYPTPLREVGLNVIDEMRSRYDCPVGLSDHSGVPYPALAAMARGVDMLELHVTFDRRMFGPDAKASLTFPELEEIMKARDAFHEMHSSPVDKDQMAEDLAEMRSIFSRSLAPARDLAAGTVIAKDDLREKKPGTGIPPDDIGKVLGRRLRHAVTADRALNWDDLDDHD